MNQRLRLLTAGESHGPGMTVILEGMPSGVSIDLSNIELQLARRRHGHGRGGRMKIENDVFEIRGGVRGGVTLGSPICLWIANRDFDNWQPMMDPESVDPERAEQRRVHAPRPGHADLAGGFKHLSDDLRNVLERAYARETVARVAAGSLARELLQQLNVEIASGVVSLGAVGRDRPTPDWQTLQAMDDASPLRAAYPQDEAAMIEAVDRAQQDGDTLGGRATVVVRNLPPGLGSYAHWDRKLDALLAQALMSIPAVKAVSLGEGVEVAGLRGSESHDPIEQVADGRVRRTSNRAGGLEGGVTNGSDLTATIYMKPISTLRQGMPSVDLDTGQPHKSQYERSDVTALPAAGVIAEAMVALVLADAILVKCGGDSLSELQAHIVASRELQRQWTDSPRRGKP